MNILKGKPSDQIRADAALARRMYPSWRLGQAVFNCTSRRWPVYASSKRGVADDPYHQDAKVEAFLEGLDAYVSSPEEGE